MRDLSIFFRPTNASLFDREWKEFQIGSRTEAFANAGFPSCENCKIALVGLVSKEEEAIGITAADHIREQLYALYLKAPENLLVDLGNIHEGETEEDTAYALTEVISELVKRKIIPLVIGIDTRYTFYQYKAYERLEQLVNVVSISPTVSIGDHEEPLSGSNFVSHVIVQKPNVLFNYCNLAHQTYLNSPVNLDLLDKLFFDSLRLGEMQADMKKAEPYVRNADIVSMDLSAVRYSEFHAAATNLPNGLYGEEICQLARYAGMSDKLTSFSLWGYTPLEDNNGLSAGLAAQVIWCLIEGYLHRKNDFPAGTKEGYTKYRVSLQGGQHELTFYKSDKSGRWWVEVPYPPDQKFRFQRHQLVPCLYDDYICATQNTMPDVWWRAYQKLL